jgi:hypothetical protein
MESPGIRGFPADEGRPFLPNAKSDYRPKGDGVRFLRRSKIVTKRYFLLPGWSVSNDLLLS